MFENLVIILVLGTALGHAYVKEEPPVQHNNNNTLDSTVKLYDLEGVVLPPAAELRASARWPADVTLSLNGGEYQGFVRLDGYFVISGVPSGSHVLYVYHADIYIQPVRVEISSRGQIRTRTLSHIRPSQVVQLPYPLRLKPLNRRKYFQIREQWNVLDYLLNPMFLLMVLPLLMMLLLPILINDPETKREIDNMQFPKMPHGMPDLNDILTSFLSGTPLQQKKAIAQKPIKKRNQ